MGVDRRAVRMREDEPRILVARPNHHPLGGLAGLVLAQGSHRGRVQGNGSSAPGRLGLRCVDGVVDHYARLPDSDPAGSQIYVDPTQPQQLTTTHAGGRRQEPGGVMAILPDMEQEGAELSRCPDLQLSCLRLRRVGGVGDVANGVAPAHRVPEGSMHEHVDVPDGLRREAARGRAPTRSQQHLVEAGQMARGELLQLHSPKRRDDVRLKEPLVARPGRGTHVQPHRR